MEAIQQVVSSATPGQAFEAYLQVERAIKANGVTDVNAAMSKLLKNKVFEKAVNEHFSGKYAVISTKFTASGAVASVTPNGRTYNINKDIKELLAMNEEGGLFDYIDDNIISWFGDVNFTLDKVSTGKVQRFREFMTNHEIIAEGNKVGIYQEYDIVEALMFASELVKAGAVEGSDERIIIYLSNKKDDTPYMLNVWRSNDDLFKLLVEEVILDEASAVDEGVLFNN